MATRTIITSQPDIACDVCERRLLRGEQHDVFLAAGQPRTVCELCAPRAAHQGWQREADHDALGPAPLRTGRRSLLERLRQARRQSASSAQIDEQAPAPAPPASAGEPYDFLGGAAAELQATQVALEDLAGPPGSLHEDRYGEVAPASADSPLQRAVTVFNAGEYPRRVASLTRSLGEPAVTVRAGEAVASSVVIVLAWELCWYSYEVDLDDMQGPEARALAQGTELSELGPEDRQANAQADERGGLALT